MTAAKLSNIPDYETIPVQVQFFQVISCLVTAPILNVYNNTSQQDFGTRKVYCVSNVTFHTESKYAIKIFPSPTVFVQWPF